VGTPDNTALPNGGNMREPIYGEFMSRRGNVISESLAFAFLLVISAVVAIKYSVPLERLALGLGGGIIAGCIGAVLDVKTMNGNVITFRGSYRLFYILLGVLTAVPLVLALFSAFFLPALESLLLGIVDKLIVSFPLFSVPFFSVDRLLLYVYHRTNGPFLVFAGYRYPETSAGKTTLKVKAKIKRPINGPEDEQ
jgi:hypothetical protein